MKSQRRVPGDEGKVAVIMQERAVVEEGAGRNEAIRHRDRDPLALEPPPQRAGRLEERIGQVQLAQLGHISIEGAVRLLRRGAAEEFKSNDPGDQIGRAHV